MTSGFYHSLPLFRGGEEGEEKEEEKEETEAMSNVFFFRGLHKMRHRDEERRARLQQQQQQQKQQQQQQSQQQQQQQQKTNSRRVNRRRPSMMAWARPMSEGSVLTLAPGRLFEKPTMNPADSMDCVALQIPRSRLASSSYGPISIDQ